MPYAMVDAMSAHYSDGPADEHVAAQFIYRAKKDAKFFGSGVESNSRCLPQICGWITTRANGHLQPDTL